MAKANVTLQSLMSDILEEVDEGSRQEKTAASRRVLDSFTTDTGRGLAKLAQEIREVAEPRSVSYADLTEYLLEKEASVIGRTWRAAKDLGALAVAKGKNALTLNPYKRTARLKDMHLSRQSALLEEANRHNSAARGSWNSLSKDDSTHLKGLLSKHEQGLDAVRSQRKDLAKNLKDNSQKIVLEGRQKNRVAKEPVAAAPEKKPWSLGAKIGLGAGGLALGAGGMELASDGKKEKSR